MHVLYNWIVVTKPNAINLENPKPDSLSTPFTTLPLALSLLPALLITQLAEGTQKEAQGE